LLHLQKQGNGFLQELVALSNLAYSGPRVSTMANTISTKLEKGHNGGIEKLTSAK